MNHPTLQIACIVSQPFAENSFVVNRNGQAECLIFDPGFDPEAILQTVHDRSLAPVAILNTHGHSDHIAGNEAMKRQWPEIPLIIGSGDADKLTDPQGNLSAPFGVELISPPADHLVAEGDRLELAGIVLEVLETPGHSRGHVVYVYKGESPWIVFGGDVLFRGSVGRTDFPDGNSRQLMDSIRDKLFPLPDETVVLSGHGEPTTIGHEKRTNPFVGQ